MAQTQQSTLERDSAARAETQSAPMAANVYETPGGEAFVIEAPVPGLGPAEIVADVTVDSVTVSTRPRQSPPEPGQRELQREHDIIPMSRVFQFPVEIDTDNVRATLERGMLMLYVPKAAAGRRRVINVAPPA
jgi:HSP20 family protein